MPPSIVFAVLFPSIRSSRTRVFRGSAVRTSSPYTATVSGVNKNSRAGLYVHVPFCSSICPYCDFAVTLAGEDRRAEWECSLLAEAELYGGDDWVFETVYFGGGTPSSLGPRRLERVVEGLRERLRILPNARRFIEANPEDVTDGAVQEWRNLGFRTVSVGVQALDDRILRVLGRRHDANAGRRAVERLRGAGFETVSIDLIFGVEGQELSGWIDQLRQAVSLGVDHISCYQLTFHERTVFGRRRDRGGMSEMSEVEQAEMYRVTHEILGAAGFDAYEVSNWARPGHRSTHNLKYWTGAPYLGLGPGAHSFDGRRRRWWNRRKLRLWARALSEGRRPVEGAETLGDVERALECLMLGLRTADGVDLAGLEERFGIELRKCNAGVIAEFRDRGLIVYEAGHIAPTAAGMAVADALARALIVRERSGDSGFADDRGMMGEE